MKKIIAACIMLSGLFFAVPAAACSFSVPQRHTVVDEPPPSDVAAPEKPTLSVEAITRGQGPKWAGPGSRSASSCDDIGKLTVEISPNRREVGYQFEVVDGSTPQGFSFPDVPTRTEEDGTWFDVWIDGAEDNQESFRFEVRVTAIDKWGRESEPSEHVVVSHPGTGPCGGGAGSNQAVFVVLGLSLVGLLRRRRE
jgi:MYXO-CTERM domain-containing protein